MDFGKSYHSKVRKGMLGSPNKMTNNKYSVFSKLDDEARFTKPRE